MSVNSKSLMSLSVPTTLLFWRKIAQQANALSLVVVPQNSASSASRPLLSPMNSKIFRHSFQKKSYRFQVARYTPSSSLHQRDSSVAARIQRGNLDTAAQLSLRVNQLRLRLVKARKKSCSRSMEEVYIAWRFADLSELKLSVSLSLNYFQQ